MKTQISRRDFVKTGVAAGAFVLSSGALLGGCTSVRRADLPPGPPTSSAGAIALDAETAAILHYAALAPSGHNTQPWAVTVNAPLDWTIGLDPARRLPVVDPASRESLLSIGAFVENLVIAAGTRGYEAHIEILANSMADTQILGVRLKKAPVRDYPLKRLELRRTVKHGHLPETLKPETVRALSTPLDGRLFYFPRGSQHANCIAQGTAAAFEEQTRRDDAQSELSAWTRLSRRSAQTHRDGLTTEGMEITGLAGLYVRTFMKPDDVMGDAWRKKGIEMTRQLTGQGAGWIVITSAGSTVSHLIDTGRRFQRMALLAREHNLAIHPMTQMLEESRWRSRIAANHGDAMIPQFILRVGYLDRYPKPVSLRRPVAWFVKKPGSR